MSDPVAVTPPPPRGSTRTIVIASIIVIIAFVAGVFTGIFAEHVWRMRRGPRHIPPMAARAMIERLDHRLDLTGEQRAKIEQVIDRHHARIEEITAATRPQVRRELDAANAEIEQILTPDQREKFQKMRMRLGPRHPRRR
ncbi:MAG TPA: hypothetical protein VNA69_06010 [Thermoanaerobaculia bacterium]|nr:hypothetical protein [Thermoanaerobaculia bacterium]